VANPSPRRVLLDSVADCLRQISVANGYRTDAGTTVTLEPKQVDEAAEGVLAVIFAKQQRPTDPSQVRISRLTTVAVLAKVPAQLDEAQMRLDDIVSDVEQAMAGQQFRYPKGYEVPQYVATEPAEPKAGMGWTGALLTYQSHIPIQAK